jgi:mono/diheme cytochrome c family protein
MKIRIVLVAAFATISMLAWTNAPAQDGGATFKTRCAPCHGDQGQGKPGMAPKLVGTTQDVNNILNKGGQPKSPHNKPMNTLTAAQISALSTYVKGLK